VLPDALDAAVEATRPGGRIAVLSYHSGEDRIVKNRFASASGACDCPDDLPCVCGAIQTVRIVRGIPKKPSAAEQAANRRAASARLRVVERIIDAWLVAHPEHPPLPHLEDGPGSAIENEQAEANAAIGATDPGSILTDEPATAG